MNAFGTRRTLPPHLPVAITMASISAALAGAIVIMGLTGDASFWPIAPGLFLVTMAFGTMIALAHMIVLGLPLYLGLSHWWELRWWSAALGGFGVGAAPLGLLIACQFERSWTEAAIREGLTLIAHAGGYGAIGGLVFNAILARDRDQ